MHIEYWWEKKEDRDRWEDNVRMDLGEIGLDWCC
jgi:hypothetical protein